MITPIVRGSKDLKGTYPILVKVKSVSFQSRLLYGVKKLKFGMTLISYSPFKLLKGYVNCKDLKTHLFLHFFLKWLKPACYQVTLFLCIASLLV